MYKIATITFHHAHNFGSVLQAYALQESIKKIGAAAGKVIEYKIIDFHTPFQEEFYSVFKKNNSLKNVIKNLLALPYAKQLNTKHEKFETFLKEYCQLTGRYIREEELYYNMPEADCYVSGSDQLWNVRALDFSWVYYLNFLKNGAKCISYAASMGPLMIQWTDEQKMRCQELLKKYSAISVREKNTQSMVENIAKTKCEIHVDPTLLLTTEEWKKIASDMNYNDGKYILLYCLEPTIEQLELAKKVSDYLNLPIVVTKYNNKRDYINSFKKMYSAGPQDFISLVNHAKIVLTSSFHGTAFSILFEKPFFVFGGMNDNRISALLENANLEERSIENNNYEEKLLNAYCINFEEARKMLDKERRKSLDYLGVELGLKKE